MAVDAQGVGLPLPPNPVNAALDASGSQVSLDTGAHSSANVGDVGSIHSGGGIFQVPDGFFQRPGEDSPQYLNGRALFGNVSPVLLIGAVLLVVAAAVAYKLARK